MKGLYWAALASGPLAVGLWWLAGLAPGVVETWYSRGLYPVLMGPWSRLVGWAPVAVVPGLLVAVLLLFVGFFFWFSPGKAASLVAAGLSVLVAWFTLGWGLNYQRMSWAENHGFTASGGSVADLEALAGRLSDRASRLREALGTVSESDWSSTDLRRAVTRAYERWALAEPLVAGRFGDPKAFPVPELLSWAGIAGIFLPFTGEPLVNTGPGDWQLPFTSAHEAAHLRGWAREDEANFLAFASLKDDPDPRLAYSAWSSALLYVANALTAEGPRGQEAWTRVLTHLDPRVRQDWTKTFAYWDRFKGPVRQVSQSVNDLYLKSQGQGDGVKSYGRMVDLLLASERDPGQTGP